MKQFSLEKYLENPSRKVVTRDGREVEIFYYNADKTLLVGRISPTEIHQYTENGFQYDIINEAKNDLFFADEEDELTELQKTLEEDCDCYVNLYNDGKSREELRQWIKGWCPRIIDLARKEIEVDIWEDGYKNGMQDAGEAKVKELVAEFEKGRQDALKDLPKWKKATEHKEFEVHVCVMDEYRCPYLDTDVHEGEYYIELDDLKTLPKEE